MQTSRGKLTDTISFRATSEMAGAAELHRQARKLEKSADAQREIFALGIEATRGDTAEILDAVRLVRESGVDPLGVLRAAQERALVGTVEVPA